MSISNKVQRKLLAASGGFCGNPSCHRYLFDFFETGEITNIEELAHIIGQKKEGPRGENELSLSERDEFDNIILLCPTCHTIIDKNPQLYPIPDLLKLILNCWENNIEIAGPCSGIKEFHTKEPVIMRFGISSTPDTVLSLYEELARIMPDSYHLVKIEDGKIKE